MVGLWQSAPVGEDIESLIPATPIDGEAQLLPPMAGCPLFITGSDQPEELPVRPYGSFAERLRGVPSADHVVLPDHLVQQERDERKSVVVTSFRERCMNLRNGFTEACDIVSFGCFVGQVDGMPQGMEVVLAVATSEPRRESRFDELSSLIEVSNGGVLELQVKGETLGESIDWGRRDLRSSIPAAANCQQSL